MTFKFVVTYKFYFLSLLLLFPSFFLQAQDQYRFERVSTDAGITTDIINQIMQDKYGFLWFVTQDGLNKYDGYKVTVYKNNSQDPNSISNNNQLTVCEKDENIWIGTWGGGLNKFDRINKFTRYTHSDKDTNSLCDDKINRIIFDNAGKLWITTPKGLDEFDPATNKFKHYLKNENTLKIIEDKNGNLYVSTYTAFYILDKSRKQIKKVDLNEKLDLNEGHPILIDHSGIVWIGTNNGLLQYDPLSGSLLKLNNNLYTLNNVDKAKITCLFEDRNFNIWIGTFRKGLYRFDRDKKVFTVFLSNSNDPNSISFNSIREIFEDNSRMLWVSTPRGLNKLDLKPKKFNYYYYIPNDIRSLSHNSVLSFYEENENVMWVGTDYALNRFDKKKNKFEHIYLPSNNIYGQLISVNNICKGPDDNLWMGTRISGLVIYNPKNKKFVDIKSDSTFPKSLSNEWIRMILRGNYGDYWISSDKALYRYHTVTKKFTIYNNTNGNNSLSDNNVLGLYEDSDGILWIGTKDGGLNRFDKKSNKFTHFRYNYGMSTGLTSDYVVSVSGDENYIWVGTLNGLNKLDKKTSQITQYTEKEGIANSCINGILIDNNGSLWMSTSNGISKFSPKDNLFRNFDKHDGLQGSKFNGLAYYKTKSGEMYFGGFDGFNSFFPNKVIDNDFIPPVVLTQFNVLYENKNLGKDISEVNEIVLNYYENNIQFEFAALDYTSPQRNKYKYILEGFNPEWVNAENGRFGSYTNLDGGTYTFRVIGSNNDGLWNTKGIAITIIVIPPFWETVWFRILVLAVIAFLIYYIHKRRVKNIEEKRKELEILNQQLNSEINERKLTEVELIKAKDEAEKSNKLKSEFLMQISHEIRTPIHAILNLSAIVKEEIHKKIGDDQKFNNFLKGISNSSNRVVRTIDLVLNMSELQIGSYKYHQERLNLITDIIHKVYDELFYSSEKFGLKFLLELKTEETFISVDRYSTYQIIYNIVENAIKFTKVGHVKILVYRNETSQLIVEVEDTGIGISSEYLPNLFSFFSQEEQGYSRSYDGNGLGLALAKRYCDLNNIQISVKSTKGVGSTFTLVFPAN